MCLCACVCACVRACVCVCVCVCVLARLSVRACPSVRAPVYVCVLVCVYVCVRAKRRGAGVTTLFTASAGRWVFHSLQGLACIAYNRGTNRSR